jgi:hypothetical protein
MTLEQKTLGGVRRIVNVLLVDSPPFVRGCRREGVHQSAIRFYVLFPICKLTFFTES